MPTGVTKIMWKNSCDRAFCDGCLRNNALLSHLPGNVGQ